MQCNKCGGEMSVLDAKTIFKEEDGTRIVKIRYRCVDCGHQVDREKREDELLPEERERWSKHQ